MVGSAGQHHVDHAGCADQARDAHGGATTDEYPSHSLWQCVVRATLGHANMCGGGQFQAAADNGAVEHRDDRYSAILDLVESAVTGPGATQNRCCAALANAGQIRTAGKMPPLAVHD